MILYGSVIRECERAPTASNAHLTPWIVERTLAWLVRYRRFTIDYEVLLTSSEAFIYVAMVRLMVGRLA